MCLLIWMFFSILVGYDIHFQNSTDIAATIQYGDVYELWDPGNPTTVFDEDHIKV